ncbi:hypothetical protein MMC18_002087 [Xylographa bjoerkii]|nr:hypothetical protein [Xylographa bjoerkii]
MDHISPPRAPNLSTGRYRLKNAFFKTSSKRIFQQNESLTQPRLEQDFKPLDQPPDLATETTVNTETIPQNFLPLYRYRSGSSSSPSLLLGLDGYESSNSPLKHQPSFPASNLPKRPLLPQLTSHSGTSHVSNRNLPYIDPLSPIDLTKKAGFAESSLPLKVATLNKEGYLVADMDVSEGSSNYGRPNTGTAYGMNGSISASAGNMQNPTSIYQHIHELSAKRVSTLDYLRKAHEGRVYWFNTLLFTKSDISKLPSFDPRKLARRATNYLLLGLSLPTVLDLNTVNPMDYLRALNALLSEFETYQQIHPPDGSNSSSLSRAKIPQMFKRSTYGTSTKGRRSSSAADIGLPMSTSDPADLKSITGSMASANSSTVSFGASERELLPGEEYTHLLTPSLPFDPDFFETFATLCDVLIDCYTRITSLISSPAVCSPAIVEGFTKADARLRKVIVAGIVKEFEDASRSGAKNEIAGIGKVVLGGLI